MTSTRPTWALTGEPFHISYNEKYRTTAEPLGAWPSGWPDQLLAPGQVWRADVLALSARWQRDEIPTRELLTAVLMWGHGRNGYGPWRTAKSLAASDLDTRLQHLDALRAPEPGDDALTETYRAFNNPKIARLPLMRAPFFTKLLYFAGYRRGAGGVQPLILDSVVANALPLEVDIRRPVGRNSPPWTSAEWLIYLRWAAAQPDGEEPDTVETRLFAG